MGRIRKIAKGPNPLSVKKKADHKMQNNLKYDEILKEKKKRKRKKKIITSEKI